MKKDTKEEKAHAKYSPSGSERWLNCSASIEHCAPIPEPPEGPAAKEGTTAHSVLEQRAHRRFFNKVIKLSKDKTPVDITPEMLEHADAAIKFLEKEFKPKEGDELLIEAKAINDHIDPEFHGTLDIGIVRFFGRLTIIDYKYGRGKIVEPESFDEKNKIRSPNPQLMSYAIGIARKYDYNFEDVELVVIQPRAPHPKGPIRRAVFEMSTLLAYEEIFRRGIERTKNKTRARFFPGSWCGFCRGASTCPALNEQAISAASAAFDDEPKTKLPAVKKSAPPAKGDAFASSLKKIEEFQQWAKATEKAAVDFLKSGGKIPGWALVPTRGARKWASPKKARAALIKKLGDRVLELRSPAQVEKLGKDAKVLTKKLSVSVASGNVVLKRDDGRTERDAAEVFDDGLE